MTTQTAIDPKSVRRTEPTRGYRPSAHWFALFATIFTWPLLFVGGLVTTYKVGMAVPDWPTTFGINMFLYDMTQASWAVFGEHTHRLYGAAVGLFTILLLLDFAIFDRRGWVIRLGLVALLAVIVQGVLGGMRVRWNSTFLAAFHGCFGQAFFGYMAALCVLTGRGWASISGEGDDARKERAMATVGLVLVYSQVIVGAWLRHFGDVRVLALHSILAILVFGHLAALVARIHRRRALVPDLVASSRALGLLLLVQIALGVGAWWLLRPYDGIARPVTLLAALVRTGHQANAGLVLASVVVLTLRAWHRASLKPAGVGDFGGRDLEAVA